MYTDKTRDLYSILHTPEAFKYFLVEFLYLHSTFWISGGKNVSFCFHYKWYILWITLYNVVYLWCFKCLEICFYRFLHALNKQNVTELFGRRQLSLPLQRQIPAFAGSNNYIHRLPEAANLGMERDINSKFAHFACTSEGYWVIWKRNNQSKCSSNRQCYFNDFLCLIPFP